MALTKTKQFSIENRTVGLRISLDQNVTETDCDFVRVDGPDWTVRQVADVGLWGASDSAIVVTFDEDFADARMFSVGARSGVNRD